MKNTNLGSYDERPHSPAPRCGRWSDAKLDKELAFAHAADDGSEPCRAWIDTLRAEMTKRAAPLTSSHDALATASDTVGTKT